MSLTVSISNEEHCVPEHLADSHSLYEPYTPSPSSLRPEHPPLLILV